MNSNAEAVLKRAVESAELQVSHLAALRAVRRQTAREGLLDRLRAAERWRANRTAALRVALDKLTRLQTKRARLARVLDTTDHLPLPGSCVAMVWRLTWAALCVGLGTQLWPVAALWVSLAVGTLLRGRR